MKSKTTLTTIALLASANFLAAQQRLLNAENQSAALPLPPKFRLPAYEVEAGSGSDEATDKSVANYIAMGALIGVCTMFGVIIVRRFCSRQANVLPEVTPVPHEQSSSAQVPANLSPAASTVSDSRSSSSSNSNSDGISH